MILFNELDAIIENIRDYFKIHVIKFLGAHGGEYEFTIPVDGINTSAEEREKWLICPLRENKVFFNGTLYRHNGMLWASIVDLALFSTKKNPPALYMDASMSMQDRVTVLLKQLNTKGFNIGNLSL